MSTHDYAWLFKQNKLTLFYILHYHCSQISTSKQLPHPTQHSAIDRSHSVSAATRRRTISVVSGAVAHRWRSPVVVMKRRGAPASAGAQGTMIVAARIRRVVARRWRSSTAVGMVPAVSAVVITSGWKRAARNSTRSNSVVPCSCKRVCERKRDITTYIHTYDCWHHDEGDDDDDKEEQQ